MNRYRFLFLLLLLACAFGLALALTLRASFVFPILGAVLFVGLSLGYTLATLESRQKVTPSSGTVRHGNEIEFQPKLLDATIHEMREGLLVIDAEMRVIASNRAARNLFSNIEGAIDSRRLTELTRNPAVYDAFLDAVKGIERGGVKVETYKDGRRIFDLRVVPLRSPDSAQISGAVGVFFDITRLERLEIVRQEFLSNVSHELRTPLTSIIALAETLEHGAIDDGENNRRFLSIIQKNAARMQRLIEDILELSAIEAGNVNVNRERIRLRSLVDDVIVSLSAGAMNRNITVQNLVKSDAFVDADPHRLIQMLTNLVDNAIKFSRDYGSVVVRHESGDADRISVEDSGEGIAPQHLDRLFERFYRVDRARSRELGGTGLGLAIVKHLARAHGGEVTVKSRVGEGTRFTIELPPAKPAEDTQRASVSIAAAN